MKIPYYQVDAFTSEAFRGNPAGVCPLAEWLPTETLQTIALENMLPETAFFVRKGNRFHLRWFTPELEMDLCGHATLGSAFVIFNHLGYENDVIHFDSASGPLTVHREGDLIRLDFPSRPGKTIDPPAPIVEGLQVDPTSIVEVIYDRDYLVILNNEAEVRNVEPDFDVLCQLSYGTGGVIVSAPGDASDVASRYFSPESVLKEDPVTGSAHCTSVPYWAKRLDKTTLHARQVSQRGGDLHCTLAGDRVHLSGRGVTVMQGEFLLPASTANA